jgi:hypothetical protein
MKRMQLPQWAASTAVLSLSTAVLAQAPDCGALPGAAPAGVMQRIVASGTTVFPGRTRPLCPYPQYAHYNGSGDAENAANFSCR